MKNFLTFVVYGAGVCLGMRLMAEAIDVVDDPAWRAKVKRKIKDTLKTEED